MRVLGINAIFHDPAAALIVDGRIVAAAEEERFSRRKHGKRPVPFSAWELPELSAAWCLEQAGLRPEDLDAVAYSYDPADCRPADELGLDDPWDGLRIRYAQEAPQFLAEALPGLDPAAVRYVRHHEAHAASAGLAAPFRDASVLVCDGRGEAASHLAGRYAGGRLEVLASQSLPHSLGLFYEQATAHLGFLHSSDEYKVMALASYGTPRFAAELRTLVHADGEGGFRTGPVGWDSLVKRRQPGEPLSAEHADLAASVQQVTEDVLIDLARWLHGKTGGRDLAMAGGVALNCVANSRLHREGPFDRIWVQPAAGDAGTALGGALQLTAEAGEMAGPMPDAYLGRGWTDDELEAWLRTARWPYERPPSVGAAVAAELAADRIVAWFQGRSEFGPRALGSRSLLAHPGRAANLDRLNAVKGREEFRPVAPMVLAEAAAEIFHGPLPSPYMLFVHQVDPAWRDRIPAVVHVDGTARAQTVDRATQPELARMLTEFAARTGLPVVVNTSLNTAGRPMVDDPRDALECFGSAPVDVLAIGPFLVRPARDGGSGSALVTVLVVRPDGMGDVLLTGPAVRAIAAHGAEVTFLAGPAGAGAASLLPGVTSVLEWETPWIAPEPGPFDPDVVRSLAAQVAEVRPEAAVIFTSFHQSPLPTALVLRMAGVPWIAAISVDYPGSLLDLRHRVDDDLPEAERNVSLARAAGFPLPSGDTGGLAVTAELPDPSRWVRGPYVVVHAQASVPARAPSVDRVAAMVSALARAGHRVLVTGSDGDAAVTAAVCAQAPGAVDLGGRTSLRMLAAVLAAADVVVAPNTGAAHLAAAVGTPVVSLFAPVVPAVRWAPYGVPYRLLGRQDAACAGTRARICPVPGHPCLDSIDPAEVVAAVAELSGLAEPAEPAGRVPTGAGR